MPNENPLLDFSELPRFASIRPEHVTPAMEALLAGARAAVERVTGETAAPSWANVVAPTETPLDELDRAWTAVHHLNVVVSTPEMREAYNANLPRVTTFYSELAQDLRLYARYRELASTPQFATLDAASRRVIENALRDFRLGGAELPAAEKARLKTIHEEVAQLAAKFDENVLDSENAWSLFVENESDLDGVPQDVIVAARAAAQADGKDGFKLTLRYPSYMPVMQYANQRALRATLHRAYATRSSELGADPKWDNTGIVARILELRREEAKLLGMANYAELSLVPKMAQSPRAVLDFLHDLACRAKPYAERDFAALTEFARDELGLEKLEPWDLAYASEKLKAQRHSFSEQEVKRYFPEDRVLAGLFRLIETIYEVEIDAAVAETWHPDVHYFEIRDRMGALQGAFYLDLYARAGKQSGAWMDDAINRRRDGARVQHPVAYLTCNFSAPVGGKPAYFTHREVVTLFQEFGHGLHQLLTRVDVAGVSGIQGVEWDAVELPSQFMENFTWEWDVLSAMTSHADTGAPLPRSLFDRMLAAKNFQSGMATMRQLEFGLFDMLLHTQAPDDRIPPLVLRDAVRREVAVTPSAPYDRSIYAFGHIFAGGYAAGYYSYKWAEVLSADAFSLFEESGVLSPVVGGRFRDEVLARGGSRPALESFVAFRGRPPQLDALLRHNGMTASS